MVRAFRHVWFAGMYEFDLVLLLLQQMCVFLVIAWLMSKTRLFIPLMQVTVRLPHKLLCYVTFSIFCIMGTYFGLHIEDSIANTRAIGAVMGGLLGCTCTHMPDSNDFSCQFSERTCMYPATP